MSTILEALQQSEKERQNIAGENPNKPYSIDIKYNQRRWMLPSMLSLSIVILSSLFWWISSWVFSSNITPTNISHTNAIAQKSLAVQESVATVSTKSEINPENVMAVAPLPKAVPEVTNAEHEQGFESKSKFVNHQKSRLEHNPEKTDIKQNRSVIRDSKIAETSKKTSENEGVSSATVSNNSVNVEKVDPLKDVPVLNISGYIRNDQNVSMVIINNQLVREGEEISNGLRVIKILNDSVILSYRGYVFSR
jgi:hypothetical protein